MLQRTDRSSFALILTQQPRTQFQIPCTPKARRTYSKSSSFPEAIIACMAEDRPPTQQEIGIIAARIWEEWAGITACPWRVAANSALGRKIIAAAHVALGSSSKEQALSQVPLPSR